jgi:hypothetical protein
MDVEQTDTAVAVLVCEYPLIEKVG